MENPNDAKPQAEPGAEAKPANNPELADDSLQEWIKRARRAHELVDAVDLDKVAQHDPGEVQKMAAIREALGQLEDGGEVSHVEGVDEVVHEDATMQSQKAALVALIDKFGWSDRINRTLYRSAETTEFKPLDLIPHFEGLPEFDICLAPEACVTVGYFGLFISASGLFAATIQDPPSKYHWQIVQSRPIDNQTELISSIRQFSQHAFE
ncbi:MAG: hypothetical protein RIC89_14610 [Pseudomonadales bacterium]